jgi:hypothetical protein
MSNVKAALFGLFGGITIGLIWALEDVNYYAGVILGLIALVACMGILAKKVR